MSKEKHNSVKAKTTNSPPAATNDSACEATSSNPASPLEKFSVTDVRVTAAAEALAMAGNMITVTPASSNTCSNVTAVNFPTLVCTSSAGTSSCTEERNAPTNPHTNVHPHTNVSSTFTAHVQSTGTPCRVTNKSAEDDQYGHTIHSTKETHESMNCMKITDKTSNAKNSSGCKTSAGRWTREEHEAFLEGLKIHGREWKKVAERITTRTSAQIRSHAQKYFAKLAKEGSLSQHGAQSILINEDQLSGGQGLNGCYLSSSVLSKIEKITKDPSGVQEEVESTLKKLHERYRQLQIQLEEARQQQKKSHSVTTVAGTRLDLDHESLSGPATAALASLQDEQPLHDFVSIDSVSSVVPAADEVSNASLSSASTQPEHMVSPDRNLVNGELIALEVLGGHLPSLKRNSDLSSEEQDFFVVKKRPRCLA